MHKKPLRVLGPYPNRAGFRLVVLEGASRRAVTARTLPEALALKEDLIRALGEQAGRVIGQALAEYKEHLIRVRGIADKTARHVERTLSRFLPVTESLSAITPERAARIYQDETQRISCRGTPVAADSHRLMLNRARSFFAWARERGLLTHNPFAAVQPVGRRRSGKPQLRIDEARKFMAVALQEAQAGDALAVGVLLMLLLGLRASEVLQRPVRDVDDGGCVLWISRGKTRNSRRRLQVPEVLQPLLRRLAHGKEPAAWLLGTTRTGRPKHLEYLWAKVHALCAAAGVPVVCSHSLRGLHSTLAIEAGATAGLVAAALGHGSFAVTARHYADPDALLGAQARRVSSALGPGDGLQRADADPAAAQTISRAQLSEALRDLLTHEQLQQLQRKLFCN